MFSRRQQLVLVSFVLMVAAVWGVDRTLSGGTNAAIIGGAMAKLKATRHFVGSVSVVSAVPVEGVGRQAVITMAKGHFGLPPGKTLTGAWTVSIKGASDDSVADFAEVDMAVPGDGKMYLRPKLITAALDLKIFPKTATDKWMVMPATALWPEPSSSRVDAAAAWQGLFEAFVTGEDVLVLSREISDSVAGEPCWHFVLGLQSTSVATYGVAFERLRLGRDLTADERKHLEDNFASADPTVDLWVSKRSGEARQAVLSYISHPDGLTPQPVIVTLQMASYPPYEPVPNPLSTADAPAPASRP